MSTSIRSLVVAASLVMLGSPLLAQQLSSSPGTTMPPALRAPVRAATAPPEYELKSVHGASEWTARNAAHGLRAEFSAVGVELEI
ncbi:MAG TPA: hypothetical protein VFD43_09595, partial [Planctomycetota bacterium]|nr:hypothetical protein [Planctomycetota bacterium]